TGEACAAVRVGRTAQILNADEVRGVADVAGRACGDLRWRQTGVQLSPGVHVSARVNVARVRHARVRAAVDPRISSRVRRHPGVHHRAGVLDAGVHRGAYVGRAGHDSAAEALVALV